LKVENSLRASEGCDGQEAARPEKLARSDQSLSKNASCGEESGQVSAAAAVIGLEPPKGAPRKF
jgi:hypothetical protein